jgi:uncharacterized phage-associated protein
MNNNFNFDPAQIANYFTCTIDREAGDSITLLKLQKLMFYAQAWSLVVFNKALFEEDFQAWSHGPVLPSVYERYKQYAHQSIPICNCDNNLPDEVSSLLEEIKAVYGEKSAKYLENLTHSELPWIEARGGIAIEMRSTTPISKTTMKNYYTKLQELTELDEVH